MNRHGPPHGKPNIVIGMGNNGRVSGVSHAAREQVNERKEAEGVFYRKNREKLNGQITTF